MIWTEFSGPLCLWQCFSKWPPPLCITKSENKTGKRATQVLFCLFYFLWQQGWLAKSCGYHELCDLGSWKEYFLQILSNWFILYLPTPRDLTYTLSTLGVHDRRKPQSWEWVDRDTPPHGPKHNHTIPTTQTHTHIHIINTHTHTRIHNKQEHTKSSWWLIREGSLKYNQVLNESQIWVSNCNYLQERKALAMHSFF